MAQIGPHAVLLALAAEGRPFANDVDYPYREENNFLYLTGVRQSGAVLLLVPGAVSGREVLFLPVKERRAQLYTGSVISPDEAKAVSGIADVRALAELPQLLNVISPALGSAVLAEHIAPEHADPAPAKEAVDAWKKQYEPTQKAVKQENAEVYLFLPQQMYSQEYRREQSLAAALASVSAGFSVRNAQPVFRQLRLIKSPYEIALVQQAIDISAEGFARAWAMVAPGLHEYDLQAEFDYTYTRRRARFGYPSIVGGGGNGTILHYEENSDELKDGTVVVLDAGAEYEGYSADVTRTFAVNGRFSEAQAQIYRLVYRAQQAAIVAARPGQPIGTILHKDSESFSGAAGEVLRNGLLQLGLMTDKDNDEQLRVWLPHGITHQLGMNVHDIAKTGLELAPGMIVTVEPGLYFRPDALEALPKTPDMAKFASSVKPAFEKFKGIGVRIEDDILITPSGVKILSAEVPSKLEDVEAAMARLKSGHHQTSGSTN